MKMKTLAVNGHQFRVNDDGAVRYDEAQTLTDEQQEQARENINAAKKTGDGILIVGNNASAAVEVLNKADETGHKHTTLCFLGYSDGTVKLSRLTDGEKDWDAATVGQVNAALEEKQEQIDTLTNHATYKNLYGKVEITADDVAAAGDEGITCIAIGSEEVDLSRYDDIIIKFYVPASEEVNSANSKFRILATTSENDNLDYDQNRLFWSGTPSSTPTAFIQYDTQNHYVLHTVWQGDNFLYGEMMRNYTSSYGYPARTEGWSFIHSNFAKSKKKYFHLYTDSFKFPAGTYVEVYGR